MLPELKARLSTVEEFQEDSNFSEVEKYDIMLRLRNFISQHTKRHSFHHLAHVESRTISFKSLWAEVKGPDASVPFALELGMMLHEIGHSGSSENDFVNNIKPALSLAHEFMEQEGFKPVEILQALDLIVATTSFDADVRIESQDHALAVAADLGVSFDLLSVLENSDQFFTETQRTAPDAWSDLVDLATGYLENYLLQKLFEMEAFIPQKVHTIWLARAQDHLKVLKSFSVDSPFESVSLEEQRYRKHFGLLADEKSKTNF